MAGPLRAGHAGRRAARRRSTVERIDVVVDKGQEPDDGGLLGASRAPTWRELLRERGVDEVTSSAWRTDYCVKNTVLDALKAGLRRRRSHRERDPRPVEVEPGDAERAIEELRRAGVVVSDESGARDARRAASLDALVEHDLAVERAVDRALGGDHLQALDLLLGQVAGSRMTSSKRVGQPRSAGA